MDWYGRFIFAGIALADPWKMRVEQVVLPVDLVQCEGVAAPLCRRHTVPQCHQVISPEHALVVGVRMVDLCQVPRELQCARQPILRSVRPGLSMSEEVGATTAKRAPSCSSDSKQLLHGVTRGPREPQDQGPNPAGHASAATMRQNCKVPAVHTL